MNEPTQAAPEWLSLEPDEHVWLQTAPSRNLLLGSLVCGFLILTGVAIIVSVFTDLATGRTVTFTMLLLVLSLVAGVYISIERRTYVLTTDRAYICCGLFATRISSVTLEDVVDVTVEQSGWQHRLNMGSIRFVTQDEAASLRFALVEDPQAVAQSIHHVMDADTTH